MLGPILQFVVAPLLVGLSTLAARRWGQHIGGTLSAFPVIVGPLLLIAAHDHGPAFAATAACGTLLGLVALSAFVLSYGRTAPHAGWRMSLAVGWAAAAGTTALLSTVRAGPPMAMVAASASLVVAYRLLPEHPVARRPVAPRLDLPLRMGISALLIAALAQAASTFGPLVGGLLAALPVLASVLAVFTHGQQGEAALISLMRGMLGGMAGFAVFCLMIALLVERTGIPYAFVTATLAAVVVQATIVWMPRTRTAEPA